jgi:nicotinamidase-related amidase
MLNDFVTGKLSAKRAKNVIMPLQQLIFTGRTCGVPIIFSNDAHYQDDSEITQKWEQHAIKGTSGAEVITELTPDLIKDYIVEKRTYSGFYETGLTHYCVTYTKAKA